MPAVNKIYQGDTLEILKLWPDDFVDTIITSPPYWGLRDYGVEGQIGLEPTLDEFLERMLAVTAELQRVLKPTGVMFWNMGDSYASGGNVRWAGDGKMSKSYMGRCRTDEIQAKCLVLQNYRLILRMIDEQGWILRNSIVWHKPNAMPSSVKDRFSNSYEPVFMLVKGTHKEKLISNQSDARWLAGVFDSEGSVSISINDKRYKTRQYCLQLQLTSTHKPFLDEFMRLARVGNVTFEKNTGYKDAYKWCVKSKKAAEFLESIELYMIAKRQQAWAGYEVWKIIHDKGRTITANRAQLKRCEELRQEVMALNAHKIDKTTAVPIKQHTGKCNRYFFDLDAVRVPAKFPNDMTRPETSKYGAGHDNLTYNKQHPAGKNPGDVWKIPTHPFPEAHFATFPPRLIEPMVKAGCPQWICKECGKARVRITKREDIPDAAYLDRPKMQPGNESRTSGLKIPGARRHLIPPMETTGWTDCGCNKGFDGGIILDPFIGSGTTALAARKHGRNWLGIELSEEYIKIAEKRLQQQTLGI